MRNHLQDDPSTHRVATKGSHGSGNLHTSVRTHWATYGKLALGILLVVLLVSFVVQNANAIHVKFLVWETDISQALVIFLALLSGVLIGAARNSWQRWRLSHSSGDSVE